jgi:hypothetical protein
MEYFSTDQTAISRKVIYPVIVTALATSLLVTLIILGANDPLELARLGTIYSQGDPQGTQGYDGQFVYYIARDLVPEKVAPLLDVPSYRFQRILYPLLGRIIALGDIGRIPWTLPIIAIIAHTIGTWVVAVLLSGWGVSSWYALTYGLWVGFLLAIRLDLPEPLAYAFTSAAILALVRRKSLLSWVLFGLALFTKEVTILFLAAAGLSALINRRWNDLIGLIVFAFLPFALFQAWLWITFGEPGIGSGGAMATSFEVVPFMGFLRIGFDSWIYLLAMFVVFGPVVLLPAIWGVWASLKKWIAGDVNVVVLALFLNALVIPFLPFSTFRETGGLLRFSCGLILAVLLFAGRYHVRRVLNYSLLVLVLNIFLIKS